MTMSSNASPEALSHKVKRFATLIKQRAELQHQHKATSEPPKKRFTNLIVQPTLKGKRSDAE